MKDYEAMYRDAKLIGFVDLHHKRTFWNIIKLISEWEEYFLVLSNVGLLVFTEPGNL